jgi:phosphatidate cytidylyltransferase
MGALIAFTGFIGDLNISSIKRDVGLSDTGDVIPGHGGIMDRLDSLCFTAPIFVHLIYYWHYLG